LRRIETALIEGDGVVLFAEGTSSQGVAEELRAAVIGNL
jgi:hypothetical protein